MTDFDATGLFFEFSLKFMHYLMPHCFLLIVAFLLLSILMQGKVEGLLTISTNTNSPILYATTVK